MPDEQQGVIVIRKDASVWCGKCGNEESLYQGSDRYPLLAAEMDARRAGWRKRLGVGWVCPGCQKARRASSTTEESER